MPYTEAVFQEPFLTGVMDIKKRLIIWLGLLSFALFSTTMPLLQNVNAVIEDYWPTADWRTSVPEKQGIDSEKLYRMLEYIKENNINIHSILIIRHGYMVLESYFAPYDKDTIHNLKSVSKSFLSAMVGIALREKLLSDVNQKVADTLPEYFASIDDPRKKEITMRHLLTMTAGFNWAENTPISDGLWKSQNWVKYAIEMPLQDNPGVQFNYSTALTHLMSAVLTKISGMSTQELAGKYLLGPLGINVKLWRRDPQGISFGGSELFLTPRDMAKFGYLYLKQGIWNGKSIVPADWIEQSVRFQVKTGNWGGFADYGYWWWLEPGSYSAEGWGGQRIVVAPEQDLVVVFTSADFNQSRNLYESFIKPALKTGQIAPNPKQTAALIKLVTELGYPQAKPGLPLPEIAGHISGKTYRLEKNSFGINTLRFDFKDTEEGTLILDTPGGKLELPVGLDNLYRFHSGIADVPVGFKGRWVPSSSLFELDWLYLGEPVKIQGLFIFEGDNVRILVTVTPTNQSETVIGKVVGE
jgi:CubicO group peptidase (beta-lactamase class C family)